MLDSFAERQVKGLLRVFADDATPLVFLRAEPDVELIAAKLVARIGQEPRSEELTLGISAPFTDPERFYAEAAGQVGEAMGELAEAFAEAARPLDLPRGMDLRPATPPLPWEIRFAELLERAARALPVFVKPVVAAVRFDDVADVEAARRSLAALAGALASPLVKLVVLDDRKAPRFPALAAPRGRYVAAPPGSSPRDLVKALVSSPAQRVVVAARPAPAGLVEAVVSPAMQRAAPFEDICLQAPFVGRATFCDAIYKAARVHASERLRARGQSTEALDALPPDIYDERSLLDPEIPFTDLIERVAAALAPEGGLVVLALDIPSVAPEVAIVRGSRPWPFVDDDARPPPGPPPVPGFATFLARLAAFAASPRVKYAVSAPEGAPLPEPLPASVDLPVQDFDFSAGEAWKGTEDALADPATPPDQRAQILVMLSGRAMAEKDHERALALAVSAIGVAQEANAPAPLATAWMALGGNLRRMGEHDKARGALERAIAVGMDHDLPALVAMGLLETGNVHFHEQRFGDAIACYGGAEAYFTGLGNTIGSCHALVWAAEAHAASGDTKTAEAHFERALAQYDALGTNVFGDQARQGKGEVYERMSRMYRARGDDDRAGQYERMMKDMGAPGPVPDKP